MDDLIEILNEHDYEIPEERLRDAVRQVFLVEQVPETASMTIAIEADEAVRALNNQFRGVDSATDVLSFPSGEYEFGDAEDQAEDDDEDEIYLGDLAIAYPYAQAQAEREGHDFEDSLALLVVHGTLHLLGYDHDTQENRAQMWAVQEAVLQALSISTDIVPALEGDTLSHE